MERAQMFEELFQNKVKLANELENVNEELVRFETFLVNALGEISREELIEGAKKYFCELMDKLK